MKLFLFVWSPQVYDVAFPWLLLSWRMWQFLPQLFQFFKSLLLFTRLFSRWRLLGEIELVLGLSKFALNIKATELSKTHCGIIKICDAIYPRWSRSFSLASVGKLSHIHSLRAFLSFDYRCGRRLGLLGKIIA